MEYNLFLQLAIRPLFHETLWNLEFEDNNDLHQGAIKVGFTLPPPHPTQHLYASLFVCHWQTQKQI